MAQQTRLPRRTRRSNSGEGIQFVRCRICGDHRRVISGRHLSKHGTDREEYMEEYGLSPDELIAKEFRMIQSSRREYYPYGKSDWVTAIEKVYKRDGNVFARRLQNRYPHLTCSGGPRENYLGNTCLAEPHPFWIESRCMESPVPITKKPCALGVELLAPQ